MISRDDIPARLWLHGRSRRENGKSCRDWAIHDDDGRHLLDARAFRVPGPMVIHAPGDPGIVLLSARPRRSFPLSGRYDVFAGGEGRRSGVVTRGGRFFDASGRQVGRFRDARRLREHLTTGVIIGVLDAMFESSTSEASGGSRFGLMLDGRLAGALHRERLPFHTETVPGPEPAGVEIAKRILPRKWGDALFEKRPPSGWRLALEDAPGDTDMGVILAAALLVVEVALW